MIFSLNLSEIRKVNFYGFLTISDSIKRDHRSGTFRSDRSAKLPDQRHLWSDPARSHCRWNHTPSQAAFRSCSCKSELLMRLCLLRWDAYLRRACETGHERNINKPSSDSASCKYAHFLWAFDKKSVACHLFSAGWYHFYLYKKDP